MEFGTMKTDRPPRRPAQAPFDGSNSLPDLAARIRNEHEAVSSALKDSVRHAIAAGELLIEAKAQLKHGQCVGALVKQRLGSPSKSDLRAAPAYGTLLSVPTLLAYYRLGTWAGAATSSS